MIIVLPSILAFLTASLAAILAYLAHRGNAIVTGKVQELHVTMNSRLDALVEATRRSARAEGVMAGIDAERSRAADAAASPAPVPPPGFLPDTRSSG